jgi:F0F1-type ATP synthase assembly protein I
MNKHKNRVDEQADADCYRQSGASGSGPKTKQSRPSRLTVGKDDAKEQGYRVLSYLLAGIAVYGGLGWLLDRWLDTSFLLPVGVVVGAACSIYLIIRRYGGLGTDSRGTDGDTGPKSKRKEGPTSWDNRPSA